LKHEEKRIEDEDEDEYDTGCVLPTPNRRGERWIAQLVNFRFRYKRYTFPELALKSQIEILKSQ
jgi:hypothetical protein